jgi:hypothetical protein
MRAMTLLVASILFLVVGSIAGRTTRTQNAPRPLSAADVEHGQLINICGEVLSNFFRVDDGSPITLLQALGWRGRHQNDYSLREIARLATGKPYRQTMRRRNEGLCNWLGASCRNSARRQLTCCLGRRRLLSI